MAIRRPSDSLSRCDPNLYSNIYEVRKRPDIKNEPIGATRPTHKDTIEISRDKLKEEALNRLRHTSKYVIAQNSFMRIGKYLFLAVAFPPYFLLFGLPKWVVIEGLPAVLSGCVWMWKKVQQKAQKRFDAVFRKVVQMTQFIQKMGQHVLIMPIVRLVLEIQQGIRRMRDQVNQFFKQIHGKARIVLGKPRLKMAEGFKFLQKKLSHIREKWVQQSQSAVARLQESVQWVKQSPLIFLGWGQGQIQRLSERAVSWRTSWINRFQNSQELAKGATDWVSKKFKHGLEGFKRHFEPFINLYRQHLQPQWNKLKNIYKKKWQQTRDSFHQKHQKALIFLQEKQEKLKNLSYKQFSDHLLSHIWMAKLPLRLQLWLKKWLDHSIVKAVVVAGIQIYAFVAHSLLRASSQVLQMASIGSRLISKAYQWLQKYANQIGHKVLNVAQIGWRFCLKAVLYVLYYFLLCVMIAGILFLWGIRSLGKLMSSLTSKFSFKFKSS